LSVMMAFSLSLALFEASDPLLFYP
jgi:hypothetical protein